MRFLIDEDLPRSLKDLFKRHGHEAVYARNAGLRGSSDREISLYAKKERLCLVTGDKDFSDVRNYPPREYSGLVVLRLPKNATARFIVSLLATFLQRGDLIGRMPGILAIVEPGRIRIRAG